MSNAGSSLGKVFTWEEPEWIEEWGPFVAAAAAVAVVALVAAFLWWQSEAFTTYPLWPLSTIAEVLAWFMSISAGLLLVGFIAMVTAVRLRVGSRGK